MRQYDSKRIRARTRFEGVSTTRNGGNTPLRTNSALKQEALRTRTSKRWEVYTSPAGSEREDRAICSHHAHSGERWPQEKKSGKPTTVFGADATSKAAKQIGRSRLRVENPVILELGVSRKTKHGGSNKPKYDPVMLVL